MAVLEETIDIAVIGAGHAGCEAALAAARMGLETVVFTVSVDSIAMMPCNPKHRSAKVNTFVKKDRMRSAARWVKIPDKTFIRVENSGINRRDRRCIRCVRRRISGIHHDRGYLKMQLVDPPDGDCGARSWKTGVLTGVKAVFGAVYRCKAAILLVPAFI